ncbi:MAG TPA: thioredoxin-disulfide reductase [Lachnospiraceae bacterium]|nr:thioredoxin-disulfide reductase [Lachnospiraceae bacterium]
MQGIYDVAIIGFGPAGATAAIYAKRAGLKTILIEKAVAGGGQVLLTYEVDNYPGLPGINGYDLGMKFNEHVDKLEVERLEADVNSIDVEGKIKKIYTGKDTIEAKTIIVASGATHRKLDVPGEEKLFGMGVSYCATCDGAFFRGRTVAVMGGGDVALEDAIFLARSCEKVYLIHRRDEFRAVQVLRDAVQDTENIEIIWDSVITEISGDEQVEGITVKNVKTEQAKNIEVAGVFVAVGNIPRTSFIEGVDKDKSGYLAAGEDCATSVPGIFAAGDVRTKSLRQIVTAVADGANAITSVQEYLLNAGK